MANEELKVSAEAFSQIIQQNNLAPATLRNYRQKLHALLKFCEEYGIECFNYDAVERYKDYLSQRVEKGEIQDKYAGFLKGLAYNFADFNVSPPGTYTFMPHNTFVSSKNTLNQKSKELLGSFSDFTEKNYSASSRRGYLLVVAPFLHYLEDNSQSASALTPQDIRDYLVYISPARPKSIDTVIDSLRVFLKFLFHEGIIDWSISNMSFRMPPSRKKVPIAYSSDEVEKIFSVIDKNTPTGKRDYAIIILSLYTGFRSVDIRLLKITDIDWKKDEIHIIQHKTNRALESPLLPIVGNAIADYILNGRPVSDEPYVFLSHGRSNCGKPMGNNTIINRMRIYLQKSGVKESGFDGKDFHAVRKTFATNLLLSGTPLESVAGALGDAGIQAAKPYLALDTENMRKCCPDHMKHPCRKEGLYA
ncbi:MAG: tyrosine-type recombinase/integrase [Lachnospiraceae bacterium]